MSIATRIEAIEEHLTDDYSVLELAGADLTNVDKNIVNLKPTWKERLLYFINNGTEEVWNNWDKVGGEGTSLTLNNTVEAPMKVLLKGNTYQEGTPTPDTPQEVHTVSGDNEVEVVGKNYLPYTSRSAINGISTTANDNGSMTISGTATSSWCVVGNEYVPVKPIPPGTYTFSTKEALDFTIRLDLIYTDDSTENTFTISKGNLSRIITTTKTIRSIRIEITSGLVSGTTYNQTLYLQLEKGSSATNWVKYQSTTYPINLPEGMFLGSIGDYTDRFFKTSGKNLFDGELELGGINNTTGENASSSTTIRTKNYIPVKPSTTYVISNNLTSVVYEYDKNKGYISTYYTPSSATYTTITTSATTKYIRWKYGSTDTTLKYMLAESNTPQPYEPYGSNEWYLEKKIGKVVLDGSEGWTSYTDLGTNTRMYYQLGNIFYRSPGYSNYFSVSSNWTDDITNVCLTPYQASLVAIKMPKSCLTTTDLRGMKDWLSTHNTTVYYVLNTPTYTKIEGTLASQLEAVYRAKSKEGQTNISQTNDDLPFILDVSALSKE